MDNDDLSWQVGIRYKDSRSGKYYLKDTRFFSNVTNALSWVMDQDLKNCESVPEIFVRIEELKESLIDKTDFIRRRVGRALERQNST